MIVPLELRDYFGFSCHPDFRKQECFFLPIMCRLNDENFEQCFDITNQKGECREIYFFSFKFRFQSSSSAADSGQQNDLLFWH